MVEMPAPANSPSERSGTRSPAGLRREALDVDPELARELAEAGRRAPRGAAR